MIGISLRQLRYFEALARHGHFGQAARACAISQPALSLQVKELEQALGVQLVERGPRRARLTPLGQALAPRARDILRAVEGLGDLARAAAGPLQGRLRLGVIPTIAPYLLPGVIAALTARHPGLELLPREAVTSRLLAELREGSLDAAILALPLNEPGLSEAALFEEEFWLLRPAADADAPVPGPAQLGRMRLLLLEEGHCFRDQALSWCKRGGAGPSDLIEGSSLATLVQMVGAGLGVTLAPAMAVAVECRAAPVAAVRLPAPRPARTVGLVWRKSSPLAGQFADLADTLRQVGGV